MKQKNDKIDNPILRKRDALNPYRIACGLVLNRLKWDMSFESIRSRNKLRKLKNSQVGNKAVIVCNGPSLLRTDLKLLDGVYSFGLNKINLLFDKSDFRPTSIVAVNKFVIDQNQEFYNKTKIPLFIDSLGYNSPIKSRINTHFLHSGCSSGFARDCSISLDQGFTVTYVAMQLAFHMGFSSVGLIGCDHSFSTKGDPNQTVESEDTDPNHFDSNYFAGGIKWQLPDLFESEVSYTRAMNYYNASKREIYDCTINGNLKILPKLDLEEFLSKRI